MTYGQVVGYRPITGTRRRGGTNSDVQSGARRKHRERGSALVWRVAVGTAAFAALPPDLTVDWVEAPTAVALGGTTDVTASGLNQGGQTAPGGFNVQILGPGDRVLYTRTDMPSVGVDGSWFVDCSIPVPYIPAGLGRLRALVDAGGSVTESREDNNYGEARDPTEVVPRRYAMRNAWVFDPMPGGNGDPQASPGERFLLSVRLRHNGPGDAQRVTVSLSTNDSDVTVVRTGITHTGWADGETLTSAGHVLRVAPDATPHDVSVEVTATTGPHTFWGLGDEEDEEDYEDTWRTTVVIPIVARAPEFVLRNYWVFDPIPGARSDGVANPGELVSPRLRLKNLGGTATNVRVALGVDDPDVTVVTGEVMRAVWATSQVRYPTGLQLAIMPDAAPHDVSVNVHITADNAGPWDFTFVMPIVVPPLDFTLRAAWLYDPAPGGNLNRQANPGERVQPRVRLRSSGPGTAVGVRVALSVDDPDVTVVNGAVTHDLWDEGVAASVLQFRLEIASAATGHTVPVLIDVTADNGGPCQFTWSFPIRRAAAGLRATERLAVRPHARWKQGRPGQPGGTRPAPRPTTERGRRAGGERRRSVDH